MRGCGIVGRFAQGPDGVAGYGPAGGYVAGDDGAGADDGVVSYGDAGQDDGAATDPDVLADGDGPGAFKAGAAGVGVARMVCSVDLDGWANLGAVADVDGHDVEEDAVEVEEDVAAEVDVVAVVTEERWADCGGGPDGCEKGLEKGAAMVRVGCGVEAEEDGFGGLAVGDEFGIHGVIEDAGEHLLLFCLAVEGGGGAVHVRLDACGGSATFGVFFRGYGGRGIGLGWVEVRGMMRAAILRGLRSKACGLAICFRSVRMRCWMRPRRVAYLRGRWGGRWGGVGLL